MNFEKQCPSAQDVAHLNRGASPDRNAPAKPTGPRRAPAQQPRVTAASLLVGVRAHLGLLALAGTAITCLVFLFAGSGSWMFALTEDSGIGFAPDPAYWTMNAEATAVEALTCLSLIHILPSPVEVIEHLAAGERAAGDRDDGEHAAERHDRGAVSYTHLHQACIP